MEKTTKKTHEQFLQELWENNEHYRNGDFRVLGKYETINLKILVENKFGQCLVSPYNLSKKGTCPNINSAVNKTEYWKNMCLDKFGEEGNDDLSQVKYVTNTVKVKIIDEFGEYWITPANYYQGARSVKRGIKSVCEIRARGKRGILDEIRKKHPDLEILPDQDYRGLNKRILVRDKYGVCDIITKTLLTGHPTIRTAIDPTSYFINQAREVHGDKYDYSLVEYKNEKTNVKIISEHGVFEQKPNNHKTGNGCPIEGNLKTSRRMQENPTGWKYKHWIKKGEKSKYFDSYKVYFIECWDEATGEHFYKIGKTYKKVFGSKSKEARFPTNPTKNFPYQGKLLHIIIDEDGRRICDLEHHYQNLNKDQQYIPNKEFCGMYECFSKIEYEKIIKNR